MMPLQFHVGIIQYQVEPVAQTGMLVYTSLIDPGHLLHDVNKVETKPILSIPSNRILPPPLSSRLLIPSPFSRARSTRPWLGGFDQGAIFANAVLTSTSFTGADVENADFTDVSLATTHTVRIQRH